MFLCVVPHKLFFEEMKQAHENDITKAAKQSKLGGKKKGNNSSYQLHRVPTTNTAPSSSPLCETTDNKMIKSAPTLTDIVLNV